MHTDNVETKTVTDYVQAVTDLMVKHHHPDPEAWKVGLSSDANESADLSMQRFLVNRQLRLIVGVVPQAEQNTSMDARYCLVDKGDFKRSLELIEKEVIPCMIKNQLPTVK